MTESFILVGGSGFLGQTVAHQLRVEGVSAHLIDTTPPGAALADLPFHEADIRSRERLDALKTALPRGALWVNMAARQYHLPVPPRNRLAWFCETNLHGARNVLRLALELGATGLIQFSTDMVYGVPSEVPVRESHPLRPIAEYGESKRQMESTIMDLARRSGPNVTVFRPRLIMGPGRLGVFVKLFRLIAANLPVPLIGRGDNHYQMVSVEDCARAVLLAARAGVPNDIFNLGSVPDKPVHSLLSGLIDGVGSRSLLLRTPAPIVRRVLGLAGRFGLEPLYREQYLLADKACVVDTSKAERLLAWSATETDSDMLLAAFASWKQSRYR